MSEQHCNKPIILPPGTMLVHVADEGQRKAHAALDEALDRAICQRITGRVNLTVDMNEGGIRAVRVGSEEIFKNKS